MKTLCAVMFSLLFISSALAIANPVVDKAHKASYHIAQEIVTGSSYCSATAIGPHAMLTATHCEVADDTLFIQGVADGAEIVGRIRDGLDHTIYLLQGATFADYVDVDLSGPSIAQDIFTFGNPGEWVDIFQKGYIAGFQIDHSMAAALGQGKPPVILMDLQAFPGESGAGIFSTDGKLVAVLGMNVPQEHDGIQMDLAGAFPLVFKQEDLDRARAFAPPAQVKK